MGYIAKDTDYWIHTSALTFTLNALGVANYIQCTVSGGAVIQCFIPDADADGTLGYSASHGYKSWKLAAGPTAFNSDTVKYVYVAIPKDKDANTAMVVYPSEMLDINGRSVPTREDGEPQQIGHTNYYYIWLQGIISAKQGNVRQWNPKISTGKLDTAAGDAERSQSSVWYEYSAIADAVTLLKRLAMATTSWFSNIRLGSDKHNLTGVATAVTADEFMDSDELVATPSYIKANYLSKKNDDTAEGNMTFGKDISVIGNALIHGVLSVGGWLKAAWAEMSYIKSPDYTGESAEDTGFLLTNDRNGRSRLTVDELYVRVKAIFEELQVKKNTVVGGNQVYSCAANVISFTRFIHVDQLGEETDVSFERVATPLKMNGVPAFLLKFIPASVLSTSELRRKTYTDKSTFNNEVQKIRCYFLAKDGETEIENWWQGDSVNGHDLARCQTFNLTQKQRESYVSFGADTSNVYWWRKVIGVSSEPVQFDNKMYHWFDISVSDCASGSDIPAAGDHVVQFGNDADPERMNLISLEVSGGESPSIKIYEGINAYSITSGRYGNPMKARLSPKAGYRFSGTKFEIVTDYAVEPVPVNRGEWSSIPVSEGVRTCYYYDLVQHGGTSWLCVASANGTLMVDEAFRFNKGGIVHNYSVGDTVSQSRYEEFTVEEKRKCHRVQKGSTNDEPSESSPSWKVYASKGERGDQGENAVRLGLDNEHEDFIYDDADVNRTGNVTSQARLYDGQTAVGASSVNWDVDLAQSRGVPTSGANVPTCVSGLLTVKGITADTAKVVVRAEYPKMSGKYYYAEFTANKTSQDKYSLQLTPSAIPYNPATYPNEGVTITPSARRTDLQGNVSLVDISTTEAAGNVCLYFAFVNSDGTHGAMSLLSSATFVVNGSTMEREGMFFELRKLTEYVNGAWNYRVCDFGTVPFPKSVNGSAGQNAVRLDLDNDNESMLYDGVGNLVSGNVSATATLYDGNEDVSSQATFSIEGYGGIDSTQVSISGRTVTVSGMTNTDGYVIFKASYNGEDYRQKFTLKKIVGADKFELIVSPNAVGVNTSSTVADTAINVQVYRTPANNGTRHVVEWTKINNVYNAYGLTLSIEDSQGNNLQESTSGQSATTRIYNLTGTMATNADNVMVVLTKDSKTQDAETIPITRVQNGAPGSGANAVRIDLDNQMGVIPTDADGKVLSQTVLTTVARIYDGAAPVTSGVSVGGIGSIAGVNAVSSINAGVVSIQWTIPATGSGVPLSVDKYTSQIVLAWNGNSYPATFVVAVIKSGEPGVSPEILALLSSPNKVAFAADGSGVIPSSVQRINLSVKRTVGSITTEESIGNSGLTVMYSTENMPSSTTPDSTHFVWPSSGVLVPSTATYGNVYIAAFDSNGNIVDKETVPIIKDGVRGSDAEVFSISFDGSVFAYDPNTNRNTISIKGKVYKAKGGTTALFTSLTEPMLSLSFIKADGTSRVVSSGDISVQNGEFVTYSGDGAVSANERTFLAVLTVDGAEVRREILQIVRYGVNGTNGTPGERGKMGRFLYYAQEWRDTEYPTYIVNDVQAPYFAYGGGYWAFNPEEPEKSSYTMKEMGTPSIDSPDWQVVTSQFKYLITEALFTNFAHMGSFIINGNWLFSQYGMWGSDSNPMDEENGHTVTYWNVAGGQGNVEETAEAYTTINLEYPERTNELIIEDNETKVGTEIVYDPRALYHYQFNWEKYLVYSIRCKCDENCRLYLRDMSSNTDYALPMVRTYDAQDAYVWSLYIKVRNTGNYRIVAKHVDQTAADTRVQVDWMELYERSFRPNYAVDGKTGKTVQWRLFGNLTGEVDATRISNSGNTVLNGQTYIEHLQINAGGDLKIPSRIDGVEILDDTGQATKTGYMVLEETSPNSKEFYFKFVQQLP